MTTRIFLAAAAAALTAALTGCAAGAGAGPATAPVTAPATPPATAESTGLLTDPLLELGPPKPSTIVIGHWAISPRDRPAPVEETLIGGRWPITRLMDPVEAQTLEPGTPICFWSRGREVARCGKLVSADADGAVVTRPDDGGGYVEGDVNARVFLVNDKGNAAALGCLTSITADGGFGVSYLAPALDRMGAGVRLAISPQRLWNR